jgi:hypothetical protein
MAADTPYRGNRRLSGNVRSQQHSAGHGSRETDNWPGCISTVAGLHAPLSSTTGFKGRDGWRLCGAAASACLAAATNLKSVGSHPRDFEVRRENLRALNSAGQFSLETARVRPIGHSPKTLRAGVGVPLGRRATLLAGAMLALPMYFQILATRRVRAVPRVVVHAAVHAFQRTDRLLVRPYVVYRSRGRRRAGDRPCCRVRRRARSRTVGGTSDLHR